MVGSSIRPLPRLLPLMKKVAVTLYLTSVARTMVVKLYGPSSNVSAITFCSVQWYIPAPPIKPCQWCKCLFKVPGTHHKQHFPI